LHILKSAPWVVLRALWNGQARAAYFLHWSKAFSKKSMFQRHVRRPSWQYQCSFKALWHILTSAEIGTVSRPQGDPESLSWGWVTFCIGLMLFQRKASTRGISEGQVGNMSAILKHCCTWRSGITNLG
jgi:hypothetical protein